VFPNDQPYRPFQVWAQAAEPVFPSPIGMLIHPEFGLWHAYRGALLFEEKLELPPRADATRPCDSLRGQACLTACPVGAFSPNADGSSTYDVGSCADHLRTDAGQTCLTGGCAARNACPVGRGTSLRRRPDALSHGRVCPGTGCGGVADLTDRLMSLDVIHNSLIDIFETYAALRNDIQSLMPAQMNGNVGESSFTHEEWLVVRPRMVTMNQVLTGARERAKVDYEDSRKAVRELLTELNEQLGLNLRLQFKAEKLAALAESIDE
jgi:hypothetical protein